MKLIDEILSTLEDSLTSGNYLRIESEKIELKDNSHTGGKWDKLMETVCAFLNTDGGIILIGIHENDSHSQYMFKGFDFKNEETLRQNVKKLTDDNNHPVDTGNYIHYEQRNFMSGQIMILFIDALPDDEKFIFYKEVAYERVMSGDVPLTPLRIEAQNEYKKELRDTREMRPVANASLQDLEIEKLNHYIHLANAEYKTQNLIPTIDEAVSFLTRNGMFRDNSPTILGMLVCGKTPGDFLHWRCQVDAYVDLPVDLPINKKVMNDNVLSLLEQSTAFVFRNIQTGISVEKGGTKTFEYPEELIRECINNSLAHRDYTIDQFVNINILPSKHIQLKNPGRFKMQLLIIDDKHEIPIRRIVPNNPKANNPKLAKVLNVYEKWEGKGRGMKNLIAASLDGHIDLPYYIFHSWEDLSLYIPKGKLVDDWMESLFDSYSKYITLKLNGSDLTEEQKRVFAYFYKSEIANSNQQFTLLLTKDNNHLQAINSLEQAGLIANHPASDEINTVYITDRVFFKDNFYAEFRVIFGGAFDELKSEYKDILNTIYLFKNYSLKNMISANLISNYLFFKNNKDLFDQTKYDIYKRKVRYQFNQLESRKFLIPTKATTKKGKEKNIDYNINKEYKRTPSLFDKA